MLLKCQLEPFLKTYSSTVLTCNQIKKGKKKVYECGLEDTILFPEGGGQPSDRGSFHIPSSDTPVEVIDVQRINGQVLHTTASPLVPGTAVKMQVNWERRWDHMQQHTGQHLLSAVAEQPPFLCKTVSWSLGASTCHVELNTSSLEAATMQLLETRVNSLIREALPVTTIVHATKDAPALSSAHTRGLPADHTGSVRVVRIGDVDENMCCGTHLSCLSQLQAIKLLDTESKRGNTLLNFICGGRVLRSLQSAHSTDTQLTALLSSPPSLFPAMVEKLAKEARTQRKYAERLAEELGQEHGTKLSKSTDSVLQLHRDTPDGEYKSALLRTLQDDKRPLLLTMGAQGSAQFLLHGPPSLVDALGKRVADILGGKGGGKDGRYQGKFSDLGKRESAVQFLRENIDW